MSGGASADVIIRSATEADAPAALALVSQSLGWREGDPNEQFFDWKHRLSPFGVSPAWVAERDGRLIGYRTFMRWQFMDSHGSLVTAVRAVDTATAPEARGLGIFRDLTLRAVEELQAEGLGLVFNTPNDQSRPGYLKMGWRVIGHLPVGVRLRTLASTGRMVRSRVPAELWSQPTQVGISAHEALADPAFAGTLLQHMPRVGLRTRRTPAYLAWRFALPQLHYRLLLASGDEADGAVVFRLRRRGSVLEAAILEVLVPDPRTGSRLVGEVLQRTKADYAVALRSGSAKGLLPLPLQGPLLTARPLTADPPDLAMWSLTLGDVELF